MQEEDLTVELMREGLHRLSPGELEEIDAIITPRAAQLLAKAFGAGIWDLLGPLTEDEGEDTQQRENLQKLMRDPRYWREKDPQIVSQVTRGFEKLYPENADGKPESRNG